MGVCCSGSEVYKTWRKTYKAKPYRAMYKPEAVRREVGRTYEELALEVYHWAVLDLYGIVSAGRYAARLYGVSYTRFNNTLRFLGLWRTAVRVPFEEVHKARPRRERVTGWTVGLCQCTLRKHYTPRKKKAREIDIELVITFPYPLTLEIDDSVCECINREFEAYCDVLVAEGAIVSMEACESMMEKLGEEAYCNEYRLLDILDVSRPCVDIRYEVVYGGVYVYSGYHTICDAAFYRNVVAECLRRARAWVRV